MLKLQCCQGQLAWFPMVTISAAARRYHESLPNFEKRQTTSASDWYVVLRALLLMTSKADKLPLETEPVAPDNTEVLMLKLCNQTYSRLTQLIIVVNTLM